MENFRSMSCREGRIQMENYSKNPPGSMQDLRSFSTSHMQVHPQPPNKDFKHNNNNNNTQNGKNCKKNRNGYVSESNPNSNSGKGWSLNDPEIQRKKRVASYKVYGVEGKMKGSVKKSFKWIKHTCSQLVYGWR